MATKTPPEHTGESLSFAAGQRLQCRKCGSEIEVINPCTCNPPEQHFHCCGEEMVPNSQGNVHVGVS